LLTRRGGFADRGYKPAQALADLLGWDLREARRRVTAAENVCPRTGLDGTELPARLPATAAVFATGQVSLRHVEVIARALSSAAAQRLSSGYWAGAEAQLADRATVYRPGELAGYAAELIDTLDADGPEPEDGDRAPREVNELYLHPNTDGGGTIRGRFDDAALFATIATLIDAHAAPRGPDEHRGLPERQADALGEVCGYVLTHGAEVPDAGGERPHVNVLISLEDLEGRARHATLDHGGLCTPDQLRMLCCDARVVPIVLGGEGQPLDVGRARRTVPDGMRRAVTARDRGCAYPGCDRPPAWCEVHHIVEWQHGGPTAISNLVMLCRLHHRLLHHPGWTVRIHHGLPEFVPPRWIDPQQHPRRKPPRLRATG
jgi:Domain of unknown function (DUF222)/HNH endonuclease